MLFSENDETFKVMDENGKIIECDILYTFDSMETGKSYVVYTDNSKDENGNINVFASTYDPNNDEAGISPIETEQEWKVVETILLTLQEDIKKKMEGN